MYPQTTPQRGLTRSSAAASVSPSIVTHHPTSAPPPLAETGGELAIAHHLALHRCLELKWNVSFIVVSHGQGDAKGEPSSAAEADATATAASGGFSTSALNAATGGNATSTPSSTPTGTPPPQKALWHIPQYTHVDSLYDCPYCSRPPHQQSVSPTTPRSGAVSSRVGFAALRNSSSTVATPATAMEDSRRADALSQSIRSFLGTCASVEAVDTKSAAPSASSPTASAAELLSECLPFISKACIAYMARLGQTNCFKSFKLSASLPSPADTSSGGGGATGNSGIHSLAFSVPTTPLEGKRSSRGRGENLGVPISCLLIPALGNLHEATRMRRARLLTLAKQRKGQAPQCRGAMLLDTQAPRFIVYQRCVEYPALASRKAIISLGDVCVCDIYLVLEKDGTAAELFAAGGARASGGKIRKNSRSASKVAAAGHCGGRLSVWGYTHSVNSVNAVKDELFFISSSLEDYMRLGAAFGWVYGWQLCYSSGDAPASSIPWIRTFNASAYQAARALWDKPNAV